MNEPVTLISPSGRRYTTDDPTEANTLISGHGYQRVSTDAEPGGYTEPAPEPEDATDYTQSYQDSEHDTEDDE